MSDPPSASSAALHASTTDFYTLLSLPPPYPPTLLSPTPPPIPSPLLRKSYRRTSLLYHPDKNPSPDAAATFHLLTTAFDILSDPTAKEAYDAALVARMRRKRKGEEMGGERRRLKEELEGREREAREKVDREGELAREVERLRREGGELRRRREEALRKAEEEEREELEQESQRQAQHVPAQSTPPQQQTTPQPTQQQHQQSTDLHRTLRIRHKPLPTLAAIFTAYGTISDTLTKPPKKPSGPSTTLVVYTSLLSAHSAIQAFTSGSLPAQIKDVKWACGEEPTALLQPLLDHVHRGRVPLEHIDADVPPTLREKITTSSSSSSSTATTKPPGGPPKFSFSTAAKRPGDAGATPPPGKVSSTQTPAPAIDGAEYENITLMRLREAERRRLEEEIRRKEEEEERAEKGGAGGGEGS